MLFWESLRGTMKEGLTKKKESEKMGERRMKSGRMKECVGTEMEREEGRDSCK